MTTPEGRITKHIRAWLQGSRAMGDKIWWMKLHGGPMGTAGAPDWHVLWEGVPIYIEVKRPGKKLTKLQESRMREIRRAGGIAFDVDSFTEFLNMMGEAKRDQRKASW